MLYFELSIGIYFNFEILILFYVFKIKHIGAIFNNRRTLPGGDKKA